MVIISVTREVSFHGFLFKAATFTLELFNVSVKLWDVWTINCCGATVGNEKQHNRDLREIQEVGRILEFITFYQNA